MGLFGNSPAGFGAGPSLLGGRRTSVGLIPDLTVDTTVDPSRLGSTEEERTEAERRAATFLNDLQQGGDASDALARATEGANELIALGTGADGPTRRDDTAPRGTPLTEDERPNLNREYFRRGEARIRALTELFGEDALILGHLLFTIPPLAIRVKKGNITYRWKALRTKESIAVKSGNGECYIEIDLVFVGFHQIQTSLAELIALWKKVPFCFIENVHIRKMMIPDHPDESMAVCLENLVMDVVSGKPNTVYATLLTKWFNYRPYSRNFWFRKDWEPSQTNMPRQRQSGDGGPQAEDNSRTAEGGEASPPQMDSRTSVLIDLSAIQSIETLDMMGGGVPPEVGLFESEQVSNPGDPNMHGTYPVVYPFNSQPFLDRVRQGEDRPIRISSWGDSLTMNWNSFVRMSVPRSWQYTLNREPEVSIAAPHSRDRGAEATIPPPVTGERDIVLFIGDSIMVGFTALGSRTECKQPGGGGPSYSTPTFFEWTGNTRFPATDGFTYIAMCRVGAGSTTLRNWWNAKKGDSSLKADGNDGLCSRVAGVLIHTATNDGSDGPNIAAIRTIMTEASEFGAIPILLPMPPSRDADHLSPQMLSHLRLFSGWGSSVYQSYMEASPNYHAEMTGLVNSINNAMFLDYHELMADASFRTSRAAPLAEQYMNKNSPSAGYYNIHWNASGYSAAGNWIQQRLPWSSLRGVFPEPEENSNLWTVCEIEDGDTIWVWGTHPDSDETVIRNVRLKFIDTPETYGEFRDDAYNADGTSPMPEGQDSYRPNSAKYGNIAKEALESQIGRDDQVRIEWYGTGYYGRYLGVIFRGEINLNEWVVRQGYAFASLSNDPEESRPYLFAENEAKGEGDSTNAPRGVWAQQQVPLSGLPDGFDTTVANSLRTLMRPTDYRTVYASSEDGGHEGVPSNCTDYRLDEGADVGGENPDA